MTRIGVDFSRLFRSLTFFFYLCVSCRATVMERKERGWEDPKSRLSCASLGCRPTFKARMKTNTKRKMRGKKEES
jgi:hypothetical protein